jgi:putative pyrroloquinoline-quinone-binding quinoprotein
MMLRPLLLLAVTLLAVGSIGAVRPKPCSRLCRHDVTSCVSSCRAGVDACRQTACADLSRSAARACRASCHRRCKKECRAPIVADCRADGDRTRCRPATATTTVTASSTTSVTASTTTLPGRVDWATYGFDQQRTAKNPSESTLAPANVAGLVRLWSVDVGAVVTASPVLASGLDVDGVMLAVLYVGTAQGDLYALDAATGAVV